MGAENTVLLFEDEIFKVQNYLDDFIGDLYRDFISLYFVPELLQFFQTFMNLYNLQVFLYMYNSTCL